MMNSLRKVLELAVGLLFAIPLLLAFVGVMLALFGGLADLENVKTLGGGLAKVGLLTFVVLLLSQIGGIFGTGGLGGPGKSAQASTNALSKKEEK